MASTKGYSYEKGSGLYVTKRGCVIRHLSFYHSSLYKDV